jgi:HEAT repeat protein/serine phosphatase RsbU (regulator of sigma subunit)
MRNLLVAGLVGWLVLGATSQGVTFGQSAGPPAGAEGPEARVERLINQLGDPEPGTRQEAVLGLSRYASTYRTAKRALIRALEDPDAAIRRLAAEGLGRISQRVWDAVPQLTAALKDEAAAVAEAAARALGNIGPEARSAVDGLIEALAAACPPRLRIAAAEALGRIGPDAGLAEEDLSKILEDDHSKSDLRNAAAVALGRVGARSERAVLALVRAQKTAEIKNSAAVSLQNIGTAAARPLAETLRRKTEAPAVREAAAVALGRIGSREPFVKSALQEALRADSDSRVRVAAARALQAIGEKPVDELVRIMKKNGDSALRMAAIEVLGRIGPEAEAAVDVLCTALDEPDDVKRIAAAAEALGRIGRNPKKAVPALGGALQKNHDLFVKRNAAVALGRFGRDARGEVQVLHAALGDMRDQVQRAAAEALGRIGPDAQVAVGKLIELLKSGPRTVRPAAATALASLRDRAVGPLVELLYHDNATVRQSAIDTLVKAGPKAVEELARVLLDKKARPEPVYHAAVGLGRMGQEARRAVKELSQALNTNGDVGVQQAAAEALGKIGPASRDAVPALRQALSGTRAVSVQQAAAGALGRIGPEAGGAVKELTQALNTNRAVGVQQAAAKALGTIGPASRDAVPALRQALSGTSAVFVQQAAAEALGRIGPDAQEVVPELAQALKGDRNSFVRRSAAVALGQIGRRPNDAVAPLVACLEDRAADLSVREAAADALGRFGPDASKAVKALLEALKDDRTGFTRLSVRKAAARALGLIGTSDKKVVLALAELLKDTSAALVQIAAEALGQFGTDGEDAAKALAAMLANRKKQPAERQAAARALGSIGRSAGAAVPELRDALGDPDPRWTAVRRAAAYALGRIGTPEEDVVDDLVQALCSDTAPIPEEASVALGRIGGARAVAGLVHVLHTDRRDQICAFAAEALGMIGPDAKDAVKALLVALKRDDLAVQRAAAEALGHIGPPASTAVEPLRQALVQQDQDDFVKRAAAESLGRIGPEAREAVETLGLVLQSSDENLAVRQAAAQALGRIGPRARRAVAALRDAVEDDDPIVRRNAAEALGRIGPDATMAWSTLRRAARDDCDEDVRRAAQIAADLIGPPRVLATLLPVLEIVTCSTAALLVLWLALWWVRPLWLLRINEALTRLALSLPPFCAWLPGTFGYLLLVRLFRHSPRALDAWVLHHADRVRASFAAMPTVEQRSIHVPLPAKGAGNPIRTPDELRWLFSARRVCLLIWGNAGTGKTSLACQLGRAALEANERKRLAPHLMLPVLLEPGLTAPGSGAGLVLEALRTRLACLVCRPSCPSRSLLEALLHQQRLLVIVDGYSEMSPRWQDALHPEHPDFPIKALVVTSRRKEPVHGAAHTELITRPVENAYLMTFVQEYLRLRDRSSSLPAGDMFSPLKPLRDLEGAITAHLARLCADAMFPSSGDPAHGDLLAELPTLLTQYVGRLNQPRGTGPDNDTVRRDARAVAWRCVRDNYFAAAAHRDEVVQALREVDRADAERRLAHLQDALHLVQVQGPAQDQVAFTLPCLAEYLAGLYLVDRHGDNWKAWETFLETAQAHTLAQQAPEGVRRFLQAVWYCCQATGPGARVPDPVLASLEQMRAPGLLSDLLRDDMDTARKMLDRLFPHESLPPLPGVQVGHARRRASNLSGDFYQFIVRKDSSSLGIYSIDVEGHGFPAAFKAACLVSALSNTNWGHGLAYEELQRADELVEGNPLVFGQDEPSFCMSFAEIDLGNREVRYANAGMPRLLLLPADQDEYQELDARGILVGRGYRRYSPRHQRRGLGEGDLLVLVSDGVTQARNARQVLFGQGGVAAAVLKNRNRTATEIAHEVLREAALHAGALTPEDDQIVIVTRIAARTAAPVANPVASEGEEEMFSLVNETGVVGAWHDGLRKRLEAHARQLGFTELRRIEQVWSATWEAVQNALKHGSSAGDRIKVFMPGLDEAGRLQVDIVQPRGWEECEAHLGAVAKTAVDAGEFLLGGTVVMLWLADEVQVSERGRRVSLRFGPAVRPQRRVKVPGDRAG